MPQKLILPFIETMATQVCNLSCLGCTNYSDLAHTGYVPWSDMRSQIESWQDILEFPDFGIMGGEPLINPEIEQWIIGIRELLPNAQIRFTTNGLLLKKYPKILDLFNYIGNSVFKITVHKTSVELENFITTTIDSHWDLVNEHGIARWKNSNGVRFQVNRPTQFLKTYKNNYANMAPHASEPTLAFENCIQKTCPLLYKGKIYKCSTSGLLLETLNRFNRPNWDQWQALIDPGISTDSDAQDIAKFVNNFGNPHSMCRQCPMQKDTKIVHLDHV